MTQAVPPPRTDTAKPRGLARDTVSGQWVLQDENGRFRELIQRVHSEGPQRVTVQGGDEVVIVSAEQFRHLKSGLTGRALIDVMQDSPHRDVDIEPERSVMPVREVVI